MSSLGRVDITTKGRAMAEKAINEELKLEQSEISDWLAAREGGKVVKVEKIAESGDTCDIRYTLDTGTTILMTLVRG